MAPSLVDHVVADAGAFLKRAPLQEIGKKIYTLRDVVDEIRDKQTRRSLAFLPYQLHFKEPLPEHIRQVTEFSKKTGDYPSLSATDIKVLALTFQLELEHVGSEHLKTQPDKINIQSTRRHPEAPVNVAGFHFPSKKPSDPTAPGLSHPEPEPPSDQFNSFQFWRDPLPALDLQLLDSLASVDSIKAEDKQTSCLDSNSQFNSFLFWRNPPAAFSEELLGLLSEEGAEHRKYDNQSEESEEEENEEEDGGEEDDEDGGGWITPSNIQQVKLDSSDWTEPADVTVGCLTTDFAMQNVLLQIGLHVLSVNGLLIKQARSYILRCHACFKTTSNMTKVFCPHCGNNTLKKLAVTVNQDGSTQMHFSKNPKVLNPRGLRHSLPQPRGGKHSNNPLLVEDQRFPQQRLSKQARQKTNVFDPDYVAGASPFSVNDVYSRAANLQIRDGHGGGQRRANPNAARRKFKRK